MEADENTACGGEPCLPELTSVSLNPQGLDKYVSMAVVEPTNAITYTRIRGVVINADPCATFQLSDDGNNYYYWGGTSWDAVTIANERSSKNDLQNHIIDFANQFGPGQLYIKPFLESNATQTSNCTINDINVDFSSQ